MQLLAARPTFEVGQRRGKISVFAILASVASVLDYSFSFFFDDFKTCLLKPRRGW